AEHFLRPLEPPSICAFPHAAHSEIVEDQAEAVGRPSVRRTGSALLLRDVQESIRVSQAPRSQRLEGRQRAGHDDLDHDLRTSSLSLAAARGCAKSTRRPAAAPSVGVDSAGNQSLRTPSIQLLPSQRQANNPYTFVPASAR